MTNPFTNLLRLLRWGWLGLAWLPAQAQTDGYRLPVDLTGSVSAYSLSANTAQRRNTTIALDVAENTIQIGDTLLIRLQPLNVSDLVLRLRLCPGDCERLSQRDGSTVLVGDKEVLVVKTSDLKATNYTLKFPISPRSPYTNAAGEVVYFDNANLGKIYVSVGNLNQTQADYSLKISLIKPQAKTGEFPPVTRTVSPNLRTARYHALLVGVNDYDDPRLRLKRPTVDVARLDSVLTDRYDFATITRLDSPTKQDFLEALKTLAFQLTNEDNLLLFFAGHAVYQQPVGYWAFRDTNQSLDSYLSTAVLLDELRQIHTQHLLLLVDACFGTSVVASRDLRANRLNTYDKLYNERSWQAMSSTYLQETPDNSVFMDYLVKKLARNDEPYLTAEEIFSSLKYPVHNRTRLNQRPQFGDLNLFDKTEGEFLFKLRTPATPAVVHVPFRRREAGADSLRLSRVQVIDVDESDVIPDVSLATRSSSSQLSNLGPTVMNRGGKDVRIRFRKDGNTWSEQVIRPGVSAVLKSRAPTVLAELPTNTAYPPQNALERNKLYLIDFSSADGQPTGWIWVR
jgi:hypothetical protein